MKSTHTLVSYTFYYQNGKPYFYTIGIGIFNNLDMLHHNCTLSHDEYDFSQMLEKVQAENFQQSFTTELEGGVTSIEYSKSFGAV